MKIHCAGKTCSRSQPSTPAARAADVACVTGDTNCDGQINVSDLLNLLADWGPCGEGCPADLDASGDVGFGDVLVLLGAWGACP